MKPACPLAPFRNLFHQYGLARHNKEVDRHIIMSQLAFDPVDPYIYFNKRKLNDPDGDRTLWPFHINDELILGTYTFIQTPENGKIGPLDPPDTVLGILRLCPRQGGKKEPIRRPLQRPGTGISRPLKPAMRGRQWAGKYCWRSFPL